jgi:Fur family zinc uptake transcriptional regulator
MFLICDSCGGATHLDDDCLTRSFRNAAKFTGFEPRRSVIEMQGRCANCA